VRSKFKNVAASICMLALSGAVYASEAQPSFELPTVARSFTGNSKSYLLALNEADVASKPVLAVPLSKPAEFKPPFFTMSNAHQYLGLGTVLFMGLTAMTAPDEGCEKNCGTQPPRQTFGTTHTRLARTAAKMAIATVATGLIAHWDDFHLEDGFSDPDNQHVMLGATGAALMLYAVHKSATSTTPTSHAGLAELGGAAMLVAIKLTW
jgi:hypothetical protein